VAIDPGKVKFPRGTVIYCGSRAEAVARIQKRHPDAKCVFGTSTSGDGGTSTSGYRGTSTSGEKGILYLTWWDSKHDRCRMVCAYVGENGIKPNVKYTLDEKHEPVEVKP
jgi:hypothetical protein